MKNETAAVVVTYNRKDMLRECLERLLNQKDASCDILVIDNASTDGTREAVKDILENPDVHYYNTGKNIGGAGGFNYGMREAVELGYKYVWAMDDDSYVYEDALAALLKTDQDLHGNYGFLSSVAYWKDGSICNMNRQYTSIHGKFSEFDKEYSPVIMATFVGFFVKTDIIKEVGLPIKDFFIWSDDLEYSRRISIRHTSYAVPASKILHNMASNHKVGIESDDENRLWRYQYLYRNEVYVFKREGLKGYLYLFARYGLHCMRILFKAKSAKRKKLSIITHSFWSGFSFHPEIEYVDSKRSKDDQGIGN